MAGMNREREAFRGEVDRAKKGMSEPMAHGEHESGGMETRIIHHGEGKHTVHHADGEQTEHDHTGHMLMSLHAKQADGEGHHMEMHPDGTATTHHVDLTGMVEGPHEHENIESVKDGIDKFANGMGHFMDEEAREGHRGGYEEPEAL